MPVRIVLALLARFVMDIPALRPERIFVHDLSIRTKNQTQHEFGRSRSSLEETLSKKRSAQAEEAAARTASTETDTTMHLYLLPELNNKKKGGRCMDGTQAGYYYGPPKSPESKTWVFYMNGGGGCSNAPNCSDWMTTPVGDNQADKGSSGWRGDAPEGPKRWGDTYNGKSFLSSSQSVNPGFHDAHHVRIPYCTGDSHGGRIGDPDDEEYGGIYEHEGQVLYLDGHLNFKRILRDLLDEHGLLLRDMEHVLLFGGSAGGKGVFYNCDFLQRRIKQAGGPSDAVKCAPESGMFMPAYWTNDPDDLTIDPDASPLPWDSWVADLPMPETTAGLYGDPIHPPECDKTPLQCASAGMMYKYIEAPMYVKQDEFDSALVGNLGLRNEPGGEDLLNSDDGLTYQSLVGAAVRRTLQNHKAGDGVYLTSCFAHGGHAANVNGGDVSYEESLADWFWKDKVNPDWEPLNVEHVLMDDCTQGGTACNPDCDIAPCTALFIELCVDVIDIFGGDCDKCAEEKNDELKENGCNNKKIQNAIDFVDTCN